MLPSSPPSTAPSFRSGPREDISHENDHRYRSYFCLRSPQSFGKSPPLRRLPNGWDSEGPPPSSRSFFLCFTSSRREEKIPRDILPKSRTYVLPPSFNPFPFSPFRITYVRLFSRKKHTRVVKPLKSKNHNVFRTQASESFFTIR